jgi:hypothetical protein
MWVLMKVKKSYENLFIYYCFFGAETLKRVKY